jgi:hypothetical protein
MTSSQHNSLPSEDIHLVSLSSSLTPPSDLLTNEFSSHPQSPDHESSYLDSHPSSHDHLSSTSSPPTDTQLLLDGHSFFLPLETSIITAKTENHETIYTCSKGPDDLPGLKAWTLTSASSSSSSSLVSGEVKWIVNSRFYEELYLESHSLEKREGSSLENDKAIRLRLLNQRGKARKVLSPLI